MAIELTNVDRLIVLGMILDIVGVILLYRFDPGKYPDPQTQAFFKIEDEIRERWRKHQTIRKWIARFSIFLICGGFVCLIAAIILF